MARAAKGLAGLEQAGSARAVAPRAPATPRPDLARFLLQDGAVGADTLVGALARQGRSGGRLDDRLLAAVPDRPALAQALARYHGLAPVDPRTDPPDAALIGTLDPAFCLREGVLPWRRAGAASVVLCARPEDFARARPVLEAALGPVLAAHAEPRAIEAALLAHCGPDLAHRAETRVPESLSCRGWAPWPYRLPLAVLGLALLAALAIWPVPVLTALTLWVCLTLAGITALKVAAALAALRPPAAEAPPPQMARLPLVSVMVALHREADIAPRLVARLSRLDYPRDRLEVLLVVEENDHCTRQSLARADLPGWMRVVAVPDGRVRTKPRALNHALDQCHGSIIGVYDAEDAPDPDQIARVVRLFHARGPETVCLQGRLDFYNPSTNWIARCFTLEYAAWFRMVLPGYDRLGLPVPLGGTTLFFRRKALEELGGWDAWNVTEDADLGLRLARRGWRTEVIDTTTLEEANCRALPWVKQRSRWIKGYMMTWGVHMRHPLALWRDLGPRRFAAMQVHFLGSITQVLFAPLLWSWWPVALGLWHPVTAALPGALVLGLSLFFLLAQATDLGLALAGLRRSGHRLSPAWVPLMMVYHMLAVPAAWKALWEVMTRPFYWDKTVHGLFD